MKSYKVGQAPWEVGQQQQDNQKSSPTSFKVGQAPWEQKPAEKSFGESALETIADVGAKIDSYTGAPTRAAIGAIQDKKNPISAFANQFGEDPSFAPTGKDIATKAGAPTKTYGELLPEEYFSEDDAWKADFPATAYGQRQVMKNVSPAGAAGLAIDVAADPTLFIPGKAVSKTAEAVGDVGRFALNKTAKLAGKTGEAVGNAVKTTTAKVGSTLTGLPEKTIKTYMEQRKAVDEIIAKHGGDMTLAADELRENLQGAIRFKINSLSNDIKKAIDQAPVGSTASNEAIVKAMEHVKSGLNPNLYPEKINEIDELIRKVKSISEDPAYLEKIGRPVTETDMSALNASAANDAKRFLQDMAEGSYLKSGQMFTSSKEASKAAKSGAREARKIEMQLAPGTIQPNAELARLHNYQSNVNKNLIAPGKTESALLTAGSGENARNAKNLRDISKVTGYDAIGGAERLASAKSFANPSMTPVDATGKSLTRMTLAAGAGSFLGGPLGAMVGVTFTSPAVLKQAIKRGDIAADIVKKLAGGATELTDDAIKRAVEVAKTKEGQELIKASGWSPRTASVQAVASNENKKGTERWAADGISNIQKHDPNLINDQVLKKLKTKGQHLLYEAQSAKPGSEKMKKIVEKIKTSYLTGGE